MLYQYVARVRRSTAGASGVPYAPPTAARTRSIMMSMPPPFRFFFAIKGRLDASPRCSSSPYMFCMVTHGITLQLLYTHPMITHSSCPSEDGAECPLPMARS